MTENPLKTPTEGEIKDTFKKVLDVITKYGVPIATFLVGYVAGDIFGLSGMIYNYVGKTIVENTATENQAVVTTRMQFNAVLFTGIIYGVIGLFAWGHFGIIGNAIAGFMLGVSILYIVNAMKSMKSITSLTG
jgi:MFS superfamily sulfate permease-like transporter